MKSKRIIMILAAALLAPATHAFAATAGREDSSQLLVWAFLGMCALIVVVQLMPVAMIAYGLVKGLLKGKETPVEANVTVDK